MNSYHVFHSYYRSPFPATETTVNHTMNSGTATTTNLDTPDMTAPAEPRGRGLVPYITAWDTEPSLPVRLLALPSGIAYADEGMSDRDRQGVLWLRELSRPGLGRPVFGRVHSLRQRRAMRKLLCQVCGGPADRNGLGVLWLVFDDEDKAPGWPDGISTTNPPVCGRCARISARACPKLRAGGFIAVRVGHSQIAGVSGALYEAGAGFRAVLVADDVMVAFDDPTVRWTLAGQLVREISECTVVKLESFEALGKPLPMATVNP